MSRSEVGADRIAVEVNLIEADASPLDIGGGH